MNKQKIIDKISHTLSHSRHISGKSQQDIAKKLNVSRNTVANWENGISSPSLVDIIGWFNECDTPTMPYINYIVNSESDKLLKSATIDEKRERLKKLIDGYSEHTIDELLFMMEGEHGASVYGILDGFTAYLHLPLKLRVAILQNIGTHYLLSKADNTLSHTDKVMPDKEVLHEYVKLGVEACLQGKNTYV